MPTVIEMDHDRLERAIELGLAALVPPVARDRKELALVLLHMAAVALDGMPPAAVASYIEELLALLERTDTDAVRALLAVGAQR